MSGLIDAYTNQTVTWQHKTGHDGHGDPVYATSVIKVRWETKNQLIRTPSGKEVASSGLLLTTAAVGIDDTITAANGRTYVVLSVGIMYGLDGREIHREAYV